VKVLVTGGAGFVGRATVRALVEAGHTARIVSREAWPSGSLLRRTLADTIRWWAEHDMIDRRLAGRLAPKPV
jgi:uncharacterized protein YbjT (DUF2867 family)